MKTIFAYSLLLSTIVFSCADVKEASIDKVEVDTVSIAQHIEVLSSDEFLGRKPFTEGETKTINYLKTQFENIGLQPGNGESFFQDVPMVEITGRPSKNMVIKKGRNSAVSLNVSEDFVAYTQKPVDKVALTNSELVYAGYGIVAPEYGWNDYEGLDVKDKTVVVLVNDPGFGSGDSTFFKGETMTYYGRWTYKYEEAARQGAAGVLIIHETVPAGYPWLVVRNSWSGATLNLDDPNAGALCDVQGWITRDAAIQIFESSEVDMTDFVAKARSENFSPIPLGVNVSVSVSNTIKRDASKNVVGRIVGSTYPDEAIVYSAHWDHLGVGPEVDGDSIYNGAFDNASGTAILLALAETFAQQPVPERSIVFLAVTGEEQGLLGSAYYANNPIYAPKKTVANINMDGVGAYGAMKDLTVVGYGQSELEDLAAEIATTQDRYIYPDPHPGKGYFFRSDHFNFAKVGIPALFASGSYEAADGGVERIERESEIYQTTAYHRPADEYDAKAWRFGGIYQDAMLFYQLGNNLANSQVWPKWKEGSEFKAIRENP